MLVTDRGRLTIWHGDRPNDTLLGVASEVAGKRLSCQHMTRGIVGCPAVHQSALYVVGSDKKLKDLEVAGTGTQVTKELDTTVNSIALPVGTAM